MSIQVLSVSDAASRNFRTLDEMEAYLKSLKKQVDDDSALLKRFSALFTHASFSKSIEKAAGTFSINLKRSEKISNGEKVDPIFIKNLGRLKSSFSLVESLQYKLEILDALGLQLETTFKGDSAKIPLEKQVKSLREQINSDMENAYDVLNKVGKTHEPASFKSITDDIIQQVVDKMYKAKSLESDEVVIYLTPEEDDAGRTILNFSKFLCLSDLEDDDGFVYENYYVVFTASISPAGAISMYITTLSKWVVPGKFKPGHQFTDVVSGKAIVDGMLDMENFSKLLDSLPLTVDKKDLSFNPKLVKDVTVADDSIAVTLLPSKNISAAIDIVNRDMMAALHYRIKGQIKYKVVKKGKSAVIRYRLVMDESDTKKEGRITLDKMGALSKIGLTEDDIYKVAQVLNKGV